MPDPDKITGGDIQELTTWSFSTTLAVPDPSSLTGTRAPLISEIGAIELTVFLADTDTNITAWTYAAGTWAVGTEVLKNINIKNTGRGTYDAGKLTVTLHAGDNPCIAAGSTTGSRELHEAIVTVRYNSDVDQLHKRVQFYVVNLNKVPRVP